MSAVGRPAAGVRRDGAALDEKADPGEFGRAPSAWGHDPATGFLSVKCAHSGGATTIDF